MRYRVPVDSNEFDKRAESNSAIHWSEWRPARLHYMLARPADKSFCLLLVVNGYVLELLTFWRGSVYGDRPAFAVRRDGDLACCCDFAVFLIGGCQCAFIYLRVGTSI